MVKRFLGLYVAQMGGDMQGGYPGGNVSQVPEQQQQPQQRQPSPEELQQDMLNNFYMDIMANPDQFMNSLPPEVIQGLMDNFSYSDMGAGVFQSEQQEGTPHPISAQQASQFVQMPFTENPFADQEQQEAMFGGHFQRGGVWDDEKRKQRIMKRLAGREERRQDAFKRQRMRDYSDEFVEDYDKSKGDYELFHLNEFKKQGINQILGEDVDIDDEFLDKLLTMDDKEAFKISEYPELNTYNLSKDQINTIRKSFKDYTSEVGNYSTEKYFDNLSGGTQYDYKGDSLFKNYETEHADPLEQKGRFHDSLNNSARERYLSENPDGNWEELDQTVKDNLLKTEQSIRIPISPELKHSGDPLM